MKVKDLLLQKGRDVVVAGLDWTIGEAAKEMVKNKIGAVLVADENQQPAGIFTERDFLRIISVSCKDKDGVRLREVMTKDLIIGLPDDDLDTVLTIMTEKRLRHLPIFEDGKLHGIISQGDVVKARLAHQEFVVHHMHEYITGNIS